MGEEGRGKGQEESRLLFKGGGGEKGGECREQCVGVWSEKTMHLLPGA